MLEKTGFKNKKGYGTSFPFGMKVFVKRIKYGYLISKI